MTTFYEIWDDGTGNRVGGTFASLAEASELLTRVLRVNGVDAVSEMAILECRTDAEGKIKRRTILEGSDFIADRSSAAAPVETAGERDHAGEAAG